MAAREEGYMTLLLDEGILTGREPLPLPETE
jgi:hypothetical protein